MHCTCIGNNITNVINVTVSNPPTLRISGQVSAPGVGLEVEVPIEISYLLDGSEPAQWEITVPDGVNLIEYAILLPLCLPPLQFIIVDNDTFFDGTFRSIAMVTRDGSLFTLNITGSGLSVDGNFTTVTFDAVADGDFDLTSYTYDLSALTVTYDVHEDTPGRVMLSTIIESDLSLDVVFEYSPRDVGLKPFDEQQYTIDQSRVTLVDNKLAFSATGSLARLLPPPTICAIGNFTTPKIPLSSVKAVRESAFDGDRPIIWEINIPDGADQQEYPRALPLLLTPVSLAFSSDVLDIIGDVFTVNMTLTTRGRLFTLMFTSMGFVRLDDFEILHFNAEGTGRDFVKDYVRGFENDSITMEFREETAGHIFAVGNVGSYRMRLHIIYNNKTAIRRFTNVDLIMSHTELNITDNTMRFKVSSELMGWNSSCPPGSAGFRCYRCLQGYFGAPIRNVPCARCRCNGHTDRCHGRTGRCFDCADNSTGRHCQHCANRFYGNATNGGTCNRK